MLVPRFRTPIPLEDLVDALDAGHHERFGRSLAPESYAIAAAQLQLEHGVGLVGGKLCLRGVFDFNEGNRDAPSSAVRDPAVPVFQTVAEREVGPGGDYRAVHVRQAYPDAVAGAVGYWDALYLRYGDAYDALSNGDVPGFVEALKKASYFTENETVYERAVEPLVGQWLARIDAAGGV